MCDDNHMGRLESVGESTNRSSEIESNFYNQIEISYRLIRCKNN